MNGKEIMKNLIILFFLTLSTLSYGSTFTPFETGESTGTIGDVRSSFLTEAQFQARMGAGWVLCSGQSAVGSEYESITGNTTVPDARGRALRMKDHAAGVNPSDLTVGVTQDDSFQGHKHDIAPTIYSETNAGGVLPAATGAGVARSDNWVGNPINDGSNGTPRTASETRMKNVTINFFCKIN